MITIINGTTVLRNATEDVIDQKILSFLCKECKVDKKIMKDELQKLLESDADVSFVFGDNIIRLSYVDIADNDDIEKYDIEAHIYLRFESLRSKIFVRTVKVSIQNILDSQDRPKGEISDKPVIKAVPLPQV